MVVVVLWVCYVVMWNVCGRFVYGFANLFWWVGLEWCVSGVATNRMFCGLYMLSRVICGFNVGWVLLSWS